MGFIAAKKEVKPMLLSKMRRINLLRALGGDILLSHEMQLERLFMQHGTTSCFIHSVNVACLSILLVQFLHLHVDMRSMVRGALLHDFFLYDWHESDRTHRLHGFTHPGRALMNADRVFDLNNIEKNVIQRHMFPLTPIPPRCKEAYVVCLADKICALNETFHQSRLLRRLIRRHGNV